MGYESIKNLIKSIVPRKLLINQEQRLRRLMFAFYKGDKHKCPVCEKQFSRFLKLAVGDKLCPYCGSAARDRRLWTLLQPMLRNGISLLDFSPPRCLYRQLSEVANIVYTPTDFAGEFLAVKQLDITQLDVASSSYDLVTCYHVLEHVEKDIDAMSELYRVLKGGGQCFIQTPFKEQGIYEDYTITDPVSRREHFGQEDHVRIYSVVGLTERLASVGFAVEVLQFAEEEDNYFGFRKEEHVLIARKPNR